jgi:hypothetical protein
MAERQSDLSRKKLSLVVLEALNRNQVPKEFPSLHKVHEEVDAEVVLKHILHVD